MGYGGRYVWVVLCKNRRFHARQNLFFGHKIPLGETDAFMPPPNLEGQIYIRCDECGQEYSYKTKDLLRTELELSDSFTSHPLFL